MNFYKFFRARRRKGASLVEFAIVFPIIIIFILGLIDIARYWSARSILQAGVNEGANLAAELSGVEIDIRQLCCDDSGNSSCTNPQEDRETLERFLTVRRQIIRAALRLPLGTFFGRKGLNERGVNLLRVLVQDDTNNGCSDPIGSYYAGFLRPGESVIITTPSGAKTISHPRALQADEPLSPTLLKQPVIVVAAAEFDWFLPFIPNSVMIVKGSAIRERVWRGLLPDLFEPPPPPPTPTPTVNCAVEC
ncbi:MAG: hypothetical protein D6780_06635, partial [Candidatus Dadabacteria bacterium]